MTMLIRTQRPAEIVPETLSYAKIKPRMALAAVC